MILKSQGGPSIEAAGFVLVVVAARAGHAGVAVETHPSPKALRAAREVAMGDTIDHTLDEFDTCPCDELIVSSEHGLERCERLRGQVATQVGPSRRGRHRGGGVLDTTRLHRPKRTSALFVKPS
jgi:hypothetical protein